MKCDEFLTASVLGGFWERHRARRHAKQCSACNEVQKKLDEAMARLTEVEKPEARLRRIWESACGVGMSKEPTAGSRWPWIVGGVGAAIAVLVFAVVMFCRPASPIFPVRVVSTEHRVLGPVTVEVFDSQRELVRLGGESSLLQEKLKSLTLQAERDDAQRQVSLAINRFSRW